MLRIIREEEAPSLSRKLTTMGAAAADIAARRQTDPASLRRLVDGDLNCIAMKALEKARERRYSSVSELAADIQRYMEHRPVLASPAGRLYRARKFLRRHRPAAFGTAAGARVDPVERSNGLVAGAPRSLQPKLARQGHDCSGRIRQYHRRSGIRRYASTGDGGRARQVAIPQRASRYARERDTAPDGPARGYASSAPDVASEICERTASAAVVEGSITSLGQPVLVELARKELSNRRCSGRRTSDGGEKGRRLQGTRPNGKPVPDLGRRFASTRRKGAHSVGRRNHALAGGLEVLQRSNEGSTA